MPDPDSNTARLNAILEELGASAAPEANAWLREGVALLGSTRERENPLSVRFAAALRRVGAEPLSPSLGCLHTTCGDLMLGAWTRGDAARACLLMAAVGDAPPGWEGLVRNLFRHGDENERAAVTRALCLLPEPCSLHGLAAETGRANSLRLYAALALDNPYPAACYDDHAFNQVVLKCLFNGLPVGRIVGLPGRANPELSRMCEDYRDERVAAGRDVPQDLWLALEPHASPRGLALIIEALNDAVPGHRYNAVLALTRRRSDPRVSRALADRASRETDAELRRMLGSAVA
jgi:hypothetical protein